jgi:hypothetical protein
MVLLSGDRTIDKPDMTLVCMAGLSELLVITGVKFFRVELVSQSPPHHGGYSTERGKTARMALQPHGPLDP